MTLKQPVRFVLWLIWKFSTNKPYRFFKLNQKVTEFGVCYYERLCIDRLLNGDIHIRVIDTTGGELPSGDRYDFTYRVICVDNEGIQFDYINYNTGAPYVVAPETVDAAWKWPLTLAGGLFY